VVSAHDNDIIFLFFSFEAKNSHLIDVEKKKSLCRVKNKKIRPGGGVHSRCPKAGEKKTLKTSFISIT
jgi:hypothetical protein